LRHQIVFKNLFGLEWNAHRLITSFVNNQSSYSSSGASFCSLAGVTASGMVDEGNLPAARLEGIVPQPFQPYNKLVQLASS
jgi:hypothetical protein